MSCVLSYPFMVIVEKVVETSKLQKGKHDLLTLIPSV